MRAVGLLGACLLVVSLATSAAKHPTVFESPDFKGGEVRKAKTAYLLPSQFTIDVRPHGLVAAFGSPARAEQLLRNAVSDCLSGNSMLIRGGVRRDYLRLVNGSTVLDTATVGRLISTRTDRFGLVSLEITDPAGLAELLSAEGIEFLILFRECSVYSVSGTEDKEANRKAIATPAVWLGAQCFIWCRHSQALLWNGFVNSQQGAEISQEGFALMASSFAGDLFQLLL
jgi:hypothetical protein